MHSRVVLDIHLPTIIENYHRIAAAVAPAQIIAVLKADAYGLGMKPIAKALSEAGIAAIAVAELREALDATGFGVPVLILGTTLAEDIAPALDHGIRLPVQDIETARHISAMAGERQQTATVHIPLDTGMGRLGLRAETAVDEIREIARLPHLRLEGLYSHFPMAYKSASDFTLKQIRAYRDIASALAASGIRFAWHHIANSDGINNFPSDIAAPPFTHVRVGINLHGSFDTEGRRSLALRPVLTLRARLVQVRTLPAGATVSYGATYTCPAPMRVGTVAAGYADGLPLALSNRGTLSVHGKRCPILGRICMDYTLISLDHVPEARAGDTVECLGAASLSVEEWAALKNTHPYEVLCAIGSRVRRNYILT